VSMCEYCVQHGAGKKWYLNARNLSKELATSELVRNFADNYFSRSIALGPDGFSDRISRVVRPILPNERQRVEVRYQKYLHHQVVTTDEVVQIMDLCNHRTDEHERSVVRFPCICRHTAFGKETVLHCFGIAFTDIYTRRFPKYLGGRHEYMTPDEAAEIITKMAEEENVVHAVSAVGVPYIGMLCNCDMDVCHPYLHRLRLGISEPFHKGHYVTVVDEQKCVGCGLCEQVCPFGAIKVNEESGVAWVDAKMCYGCGVCSRNCPENALEFKKEQRFSDF
jgi:NAD-dependent dihydropyrimidine dehydrogenase PreA subunit